LPVNQEKKTFAIWCSFETLNSVAVNRHESAPHLHVLTKMTRINLFWVGLGTSSNTYPPQCLS